MIKVATWNICLGLKNKKDYVYETLKLNQIDICAIQEVEILKDYPENLLTEKNYSIEIELFTVKARTAFIIKCDTNYQRRVDLEQADTSVIIIDVNLGHNYRIINVYCSFNPPNGQSQTEAFKNQLQIIKNAIETAQGREIIILGDFNLDESKHNAVDYPRKDLFEELDNVFDPLNLIQLINFPTWQRIVNNELKESTLDHIYVNNPLIINQLSNIKPLIGDHLFIYFTILGQLEPPAITLKRDWRHYDKNVLVQRLSNVNFDITSQCPQTLWNHFESSLLPIIDDLVPYTEFSNNQTLQSTMIPPFIKTKLNTRRKLLSKLKSRPTTELNKRVKNLNFEIRNFFKIKKRNSIQRSIIPGNPKSIWNAVKVAKNTNVANIPKVMYRNGIQIQKNDLPDAFASFFEDKINTILNETVIDPEVYNGKTKLNAQSENFMTEPDILLAVKSLSLKNCEGHDRIPTRILIDAIEILKNPLSVLFNRIYETKQLPQQWLISKINPIHKKGVTSNVENYRPISNLCSASKIFEKLILLRLQKLEDLHKVDITGKSQHGFKRKHSTTTAALTLQTILARALDDGNYAIMASLDLSAAFDVVNVGLLLKRMKIVGIPDDIIELVKNWLTERYFYVSIDGNNSYVHLSGVGTVQGSILGPVLYAIFVSPLFDLVKLTLFADDNYVIRWNRCINLLVVDMQRSVELITKWLRQSGMKVNEAKTEVCLFFRKDHPPINLNFNNVIIKTKPSMGVLGILFDSKLQWQPQVQNAINKSKKALHAISMIKKYFTKSQLLSLITACYYSVLYFNSEIWLLPTLGPLLKQKLLAASAAPLKSITHAYDRSMSYDQLHFINQRATPTQITTYKHALLLHKTYNENSMSINWVNMFFNQQFNARSNTVKFFNTSRYKIGNNVLGNRFVHLNNKIEFNWLNEPTNTFKILAKRKFLAPESS